MMIRLFQSLNSSRTLFEMLADRVQCNISINNNEMEISKYLCDLIDIWFAFNLIPCILYLVQGGYLAAQLLLLLSLSDHIEWLLIIYSSIKTVDHK